MTAGHIHRVTEAGPVHDEREIEAVIEVLRRECGKKPRCMLEDGLIAFVSDMDEVYPELPHFGLEDVPAIADFLLQTR